jgi:hypothetical protein
LANLSEACTEGANFKGAKGFESEECLLSLRPLVS